MDWSKELKFLSGVRIHSQSNKFINISCPICGEGSSTHKHRGYIIREEPDKPAYYFCHNDESCSGGFGKTIVPALGYQPKEYYKQFYEQKFEKFKEQKNVEITEDMRQRLIDSLDEDIEIGVVGEQLSPIREYLSNITTLNIKDSIRITHLDSSESYAIKPLKGFPEGEKYLRNRGLSDKDFEKFYFLPKLDQIVIPFYSDDGKWYGYQTRSIYQKKFHIELFGDNPKFYGLYDVIKAIEQNTPVFIFESAFNAMSVEGVTSGATLGTTVPQTLLNLLDKENTIFVFDSDDKGVEASVKMLKQGFKCFRYPNHISDDFNDLLQGGESKETLTKLVYDNIQDPTSSGGLRLKMSKLRRKS